nr:hypothetical protein [Tanacetum cinerariifolium]
MLSLWAKVIRGIHGEDGKLCKNIKQCYPSIWLDIVCETMILKSQGFDLCSFIHKKMAEKMSHDNLGDSLRRTPTGGIEQDQFMKMLASVEGTVLVEMHDRWVWSKEGSSVFSVASARRLIDDRSIFLDEAWILIPFYAFLVAWRLNRLVMFSSLVTLRESSVYLPIVTNYKNVSNGRRGTYGDYWKRDLAKRGTFDLEISSVYLPIVTNYKNVSNGRRGTYGDYWKRDLAKRGTFDLEI